jgi:DNA-binding NtrC family response regulator
MGVRETLSMLLQEEGYDVETAETGREAVEKTNSTAYNLTLLDFLLPDIEGAQLLSLIKEKVPKISKIIITGYPAMTNIVSNTLNALPNGGTLTIYCREDFDRVEPSFKDPGTGIPQEKMDKL